MAPALIIIGAGLLAAGAELPEAALVGNLVASITIEQLAAKYAKHKRFSPAADPQCYLAGLEQIAVKMCNDGLIEASPHEDRLCLMRRQES